ncbi:hypothetical protein CCYA_CCYA19G4747 [Cyanidiococcus yangmingshanensis]|nr:hypothetical protein CCYA_CCYA19G4747 [Cyanidiococcus yangmingshanensis]
MLRASLGRLVQRLRDGLQLRSLEPPAASVVVLQFARRDEAAAGGTRHRQAPCTIWTDSSAGGQSRADWIDGRVLRGTLVAPAVSATSGVGAVSSGKAAQQQGRPSHFVSLYYPFRVNLSDYDCFRLYCRDESERPRCWLFGVATESPVRERSVFYRPFRVGPCSSVDGCSVVDMPFAEFAMTYGGRVIDSAEMMNTRRILGFLITLMDPNPGPFAITLDRLDALRGTPTSVATQ